MCIAILNLATASPITEQQFKTCWKANPDGAGMIFVSGDQLYVQKEMTDVDRFYQSYLYYKEVNPLSNFVIHFRVATAGRVCEHNCHPFIVNKDLAFVHNGMIDITSNAEYSDTYFFNELLRKLPADFLENDGIRTLIQGSIGWSKLVFLQSDNRWHIINDKKGYWEPCGNWYSNSSHKEYVPAAYTYKGADAWWNQNDYAKYLTAGFKQKETAPVTLSKNQLKRLRKQQEREAAKALKATKGLISQAQMDAKHEAARLGSAIGEEPIHFLECVDCKLELVSNSEFSSGYCAYCAGAHVRSQVTEYGYEARSY